MYCANCGTNIEEGARFCPGCGVSQEPIYTPPVYEQPPSPSYEPVYAPPEYEQPPAPSYEPVYAPPEYEQPPAPSYEPVYTPPEYEQAPAPSYEPVYTPPEYEQPPAPSYEPGYAPVYTPPPGNRQYNAPYYTPPPDTSEAPQKSPGGGRNLMKILIPVIAVIVILGALAALEGFGIIDLIPSWPAADNPGPGSEIDDPVITITRPSPTDTYEPPSPATPPPPPPSQSLLVYGDLVTVNGPTEFTFSPALTNAWMIRTFDSGIHDPVLEVADSRGNIIASDDDSGGGSDAFVVLFLDAGETYTINVFFYESDFGNCKLSVASAKEISGGGDVLNVNGWMAVVFVPNDGGKWEFFTSDNGSSDPMLVLYDNNGNVIDADDDSREDSNAWIIAELDARETYILVARHYEPNGDGRFKLTVNPYVEDPLPDVLFGGALPEEGGEFDIVAPAAFEFVPGQTGIWGFRTLDNDCDPKLTIYDANGEWVAEDDDSGGKNDAFIIVGLQAGELYYIYATTYEEVSGRYKLSVFILPVEEMGSTGGTVTVDGATAFVFVPNKSGVWEFRTSNNGDSDPFLSIYNDYGDLLAFDDDGVDGYNAFISIELKEGVEYMVFAGFYSGNTGAYDLSVRRS